MRMYSDGVKENKPTNADPAVGAVVVGVEEAALARTYLSVVLKGQWGFVERVSIEDEMYIFIATTSHRSNTRCISTCTAGAKQYR